MLPDWMQKTDPYTPPKQGSTFAVKTIQTLSRAMARIQIQRGHEKRRHLPALFKLCMMLLLMITISVSQNPLLLMAILAVLCTWPAQDIWTVLKTGLTAGGIAWILFVPAMLMQPEGMLNHVLVVIKVFLCAVIVCIYNHTTQWNHITGALKALHIPQLFIFILDITLKYIVVLGNLMTDLLTSLQLRSVGRNDRQYTALGGIMGVTFIRATELNRQMYEAMQCRGFTDDYEGL